MDEPQQSTPLSQPPAHFSSSNVELDLTLLRRLTESSELEALARSREELRRKQMEIDGLRNRLGVEKSDQKSKTNPRLSASFQSPGRRPKSPKLSEQQQQQQQQQQQKQDLFGRLSNIGTTPSDQNSLHYQTEPRYTPTTKADLRNMVLVDKLIEQVSRGLHRRPLAARTDGINISNAPGMYSSSGRHMPENHEFSGHYDAIRSRLQSGFEPSQSSASIRTPPIPPSPSNTTSRATSLTGIPNNSSNMSMEEMYHVLSVAFLLMEDERSSFSQELKEVENYYSRLNRNGGRTALKCILHRAVNKRISSAFHKWRMTIAIITAVTTSKAAADEINDKNRIRRISNSAKGFLHRVLFNLVRRCVDNWRLFALQQKIQRLEVSDENRRELLKKISAMEKATAVNDARQELFRLKTSQRLMRTAAKVIKTWQHKLLLLSLNAWTSFVQSVRVHRAACIRFVRRWSNITLFKSFTSWAAFKDEEKRLRGIVIKYARKIKQQALVRCFNNLYTHAKTRVFLRRMIRRLLNAVNNEMYAKGFSAWCSFVVSRQTEERINSEVSNTLDSHTRDIADHFGEKLEAQKRQKRYIGVRFVQQLMNATLANALRSWVKWTRKNIADRNLLIRFAQKWQFGCLVKTVNSWREHVFRRKFLRSFLHKLFKNTTDFKSQVFFRRWLVATFCEHKKSLQQELDSLKARLLLSVEREESLKTDLLSLQSRQQLLNERLSDSSKRKKELGLNSARKMISLWKNRLASQVLAAWAAYTATLLRQKSVTSRFVARWRNKLLCLGFTSWKVSIAEIIRHESLVRKYAARLLNASLAKVFLGWLKFARTARRHRTILDVCNRRMTHKLQFSALNSWVDFKSKRRRVKSLTMRWFNQKENGEIQTAWNSWMSHTKAIARLEQESIRQRQFDEKITSECDKKLKLSLKIVQAMVDGCRSSALQSWKSFVVDRKRQRMVVGRFLTKLKMRSCVMCFNTWRGFTTERQRLRSMVRRMMGNQELKRMATSFFLWRKVSYALNGGEMIARIKELEDVNRKLQTDFDILTARNALLDGSLSVSKQHKKQMGLKQAHKMIEIWTNKTLFNVLTSWKDFTAQSVRAKIVSRRFMSRWQNRSVSVSFLTWKDAVAETIRHEALVKKYAARLFKASLSKVYLAWTAYVQQKKYHKIVVARFRSRYNNYNVFISINSWKAFVAERGKLRSFVKRWIAKQQNANLLSGWNKWVLYVHTIKRYEAMSLAEKVKEDQRILILKKNTQTVFRTLQTMIDSNLSYGFNEWRRWVEQERVNSVIIKRYILKMQNQSMLGSYLRWVDHVIERREMRMFIRRMLGGKRDQQLSAGFNSWRDLTLYLREQEQMRLLEENACKIEDLSMELSMKEKRMRDQGKLTAANMFALKLKGILGATFTAWKNDAKREVTTRHRIRLIAAKFMNRNLSRAFTTWNRAIDLTNRNIFNEVKSNAELYQEQLLSTHRKNKKLRLARVRKILNQFFQQNVFWGFSIWKDATLEIVRHENLVRKYASKIFKATLSRVFTAWYGHFKASTHQRIVISRFIARWRHHGFLKTLTAWQVFVAEKKRLRALMSRIVRKIGNSDLSTGLLTWKMCAAEAKREDFVVSLFSRRWRNLRVYKVFRGWSNYCERLKFVSVTDVVRENEASDVEGWSSPLHMSSANLNKLHGVSVRSRRRVRTMSSSASFSGDDGGSEVDVDSSTAAETVPNSMAAAETSSHTAICGDQIVMVWGMDVEDQNHQAVTKFKAKMSNNRQRFLAQNLDFERLLCADRRRITKRLKTLAAEHSYKCRGNNNGGGNVLKLVKNVFVTRSFNDCEKGFHGWSIVATLLRSMRQNGAVKLTAILTSAARRLLVFSFSAMKRHTTHVNNERYRAEVAEKTRARLKIQAMQVMKTREHGLSLGRKVLDKLTSNRRTNLLEKCFNALRQARDRRVRALQLIRRWCLVAKSGEVMWAFQSWKSKSNSAAHYAQRIAFINAGDADKRARLNYIMERWGNNLKVGAFGIKGNEKNDRRRGFLVWKKFYTAERQKEIKFFEIEDITECCYELVTQLGKEGICGSGDGGKEGEFDNACYNDALYATVNKKICEMLNTTSGGGATNEEEMMNSIFGLESYEAAVQDEKKDDAKVDEDQPIVRGCLIIKDPSSNDLILRIDNTLQKIPINCGVVGEMFSSKRAVNICMNVFKDSIYDGEADNALLTSCGVRVLPSWQLAADRYQRGLLNNSNVFSRIKGDQMQDCEYAQDDGLSLSTIPDVGMVGIPINNKMMVCCCGEVNSLDETVVSKLSSIAISVLAVLK